MTPEEMMIERNRRLDYSGGLINQPPMDQGYSTGLYDPQDDPQGAYDQNRWDTSRITSPMLPMSPRNPMMRSPMNPSMDASMGLPPNPVNPFLQGMPPVNPTQTLQPQGQIPIRPMQSSMQSRSAYGMNQGPSMFRPPSSMNSIQQNMMAGRGSIDQNRQQQFGQQATTGLYNPTPSFGQGMGARPISARPMMAPRKMSNLSPMAQGQFNQDQQRRTMFSGGSSSKPFGM